MKSVRLSIFLLAGFIVASGVAAPAQSMPAKPMVIGAPQASVDAQHDVSLPLREIAPAAVNSQPQGVTSAWPADLVKLASTRTVATTVGLNFDGVGATSGWLTADTSGAVGATQYVQWVNPRFAVYDKSTGALQMGPVFENTLWSGFGGPCQTSNDGDPSTQYDKAAGRWVLSHHVTTSGPPYYECFAVSTTSDATGSYNRYAFQLPSSYFPDYPKVGVWPDGYYVSFNLQDQNNRYAAVAALLCAMDRNAMLADASAGMVCFQVQASGHDLTILPSDLDGATSPPAGSPNYFLNLGTNSLNLYKFHVDFTTPSNSTFTGPTNIPVMAYSEACGGGTCIPQLDTTRTLDSVGDRLMNRVAYRNFGDHEAIVANHSVGGGFPRRSGIRWYEIRSLGGTPVVFQQGTYRPDTSFRWVGSIGMDKVGDIAVGYSVSSSTIHPGIRYTGRVPTDPLGSMEGEASIIGGGGSQQATNSFWNDVTSLAIDPVDDCTFWYTNQYYPKDSVGNWSTRIGSFKFSSCQ